MGPRDHPGRQNLEPHKNGPRAAPEQETGGNPGPGPPMGGWCNGNSRLVPGFQCPTDSETYPCTTVTRTCITYPHDPSRVPGWDVMASVGGLSEGGSKRLLSVYVTVPPCRVLRYPLQVIGGNRLPLLTQAMIHSS